MINCAAPLLILLAASGCTTPINTKALEANRHKMFSVGIVKAAGGMPLLMDDVDRKKEALEKIPVEAICGVLSTNLGLIINPDCDHTIKTVVEDAKGQQSSGPFRMTTRSAYFGSQSYHDPGRFLGTLGTRAKELNRNCGDLIYITYSLIPPGNPFSMENEYAYELLVKSDKEVLVNLSGVVARIPIPKNGLVADFDSIWSSFVTNATGIPEALARDIEKAKKTK
jgi:hypothetical protein